ncbi:helix-turn-helix domain-containing protein [Runella sp. MFBS21]|uniref:helix-turn-helix domain-containing protein n=1 Tax=Runella sp. MFBS21 TaxID=3034018 RepID=UPI0023F8AE8E|nr:helix-turn-helix domain-containing protein [Runella sp. MFBS21]MDF7821810.1 helix-turn-helix domain-containing protein [Runella sp. MFBS21]
MGKATSYLQRQEIIALRKEGYDYGSISQSLSMSFSTARAICQLYKKQGESGLVTHYNNCGKEPVSRTNLIYRASLWLKHLHPLWRMPRIPTKLREAELYAP